MSSRQYAYQQRQTARGLCIKCSKRAYKRRRCRAHWKRELEYAAKYRQRARERAQGVENGSNEATSSR